MATYRRQRYLLMTLDPVHIGTGGYRLGRVDLSIVRELGTRVPKIPGTSLHGAIRSYAAKLYETPEAAGQKQDEVPDPDKNPICYTFGYIKTIQRNNEEETRAYSGVVNIFDARILLFPVYSMAGPVWVSTLKRLIESEFDVKPKREPERDKILLTWRRETPLNLGWLMVEVEGQVVVEAPEEWQTERWQAVKDRVVLVSETLFGHIVNSNLEVRTSVSINPETGAAEEKALFTYESIPRSTFLVMDVVLDDYREAFPKTSKTAKDNLLLCGPWGCPLDVVKAGLNMMEWLGVGGMGTRGFGRLAMVGQPKESSLTGTTENRSGQTKEVSV